MKIEFKKLFSIDLSSDFYADNSTFQDILIEPTNSCIELLRKYRIELRNSPRGIFLFYEGREKTPPTISPLIEIKNEITFIFQLKIQNPTFFDYANSTDWKGGKIYFFKNTDYTTSGNITVNADLVNPLVNRPAKFKFEVEKKNTDTIVTINDASGGFIKNIIVLKDQTVVDIDLSQNPDGEYSIKHIGTTNELKCYKSSHFDPQTFAYLHITYKHGAWTTSSTPQIFKLNFKVKSIVWKYLVHQWNTKPPATVVAASSITLDNKTDATTFVNDGTVAFPLLIKSSAPIAWGNAPKIIELKSGSKILMKALPNPTANNIEKSGSDLIALMKITI